jgi:hypothetical protein
MSTSMNRTKKTMTTEPAHDEDALRLARKAVIARQLTDPLGRHGFRRTRERLNREAGARRLFFVAALATFAGAFGAIAVTTGEPSSIGSPVEQVMPSTAVEPLIPARQQPVLRERARPTVVPTPHVRTRSTP